MDGLLQQVLYDRHDQSLRLMIMGRTKTVPFSWVQDKRGSSWLVAPISSTSMVSSPTPSLSGVL
jgi:predicted 3-demethylubiquinone-9 3-methyltransferase (glyoxalase superfamily)